MAPELEFVPNTLLFPRPVGVILVPRKNWLVVTPNAFVFRLFRFTPNALVPVNCPGLAPALGTIWFWTGGGVT